MKFPLEAITLLGAAFLVASSIRSAAADETARFGWFNASKAGMFITWGPYAVTGCEWKGRHGSRDAHMQNEFCIPMSEYGQLVKDFNPVKFDADAWVKLAKDAGLGYIGNDTDGWPAPDDQRENHPSTQIMMMKKPMFSARIPTKHSPMNTKTIQSTILGILASFTVASATGLTDAQQSSAAAFKTMRYGIFNHIVYRLSIDPDGQRNYEALDDFVNGFDVKTWADQLQSMGMEYVIFTAWHAAMFNLGPNDALDKWLPGHTAKRDLIGEIADALNERGIKLIIYAHPNDGHDLKPDEKEKIGFIDRPKDQTGVLPQYDVFINEVYAEVAKRYAKKPNLLGFWWDSWPANNGAINATRLRETVLREMPHAIILSNFPDKDVVDFFSKECYYNRVGRDDINALTADVCHQTTIFAGNWWCSSLKEHSAYSPETLLKFTVLNACIGAPGGMAWAVSPTCDGKTWASDNLTVMTRLSGYLQPIRASVCNVLPSNNWALSKCTYATSPGHGATRSPDGTKEYVHVFKAPEGKTVEMLPATEIFKSAYLLSNNHPVQIDSQPNAFRLTLGATDHWDPLDTVIVLERNTSINVVQIANDDPRITYSGTWGTSPSCRYSRTAGDYAEFTFTGTKFAWYGVKGADHGVATIFVDGAPVDDVDTSSPERRDKTLCYTGTVPAGKHTVKVSNKEGGFIEIQRFSVLEIGDAK